MQSDRLIELPCKVGKEIYVMNRGNIPQRMILDKPDIRCHCAKEDNLCMALCDDKKHGICAYRLKNDGSDIGKKFFLQKKKQKKDKGVESNCQSNLTRPKMRNTYFGRCQNDRARSIRLFY